MNNIEISNREISILLEILSNNKLDFLNETLNQNELDFLSLILTKKNIKSLTEKELNFLNVVFDKILNLMFNESNLSKKLNEHFALEVERLGFNNCIDAYKYSPSIPEIIIKADEKKFKEEKEEEILFEILKELLLINKDDDITLKSIKELIYKNQINDLIDEIKKADGFRKSILELYIKACTNSQNSFNKNFELNIILITKLLIWKENHKEIAKKKQK